MLPFEFNSYDWDKSLDLDMGSVTETIDNYLQNLKNILKKELK